MGLVVALLVAAGAAIPFTPLNSTGASAAMSSALTSTMAEATVQMTFTMTVSAAGTSVHLSGSGRADLATRSAAFDLSGASAGQRLTLAMVATGGTVYLQLPASVKLAPGKSWVSYTPPHGSPASLPGGASGALAPVGTPSSFLPVLQQAGATVQTLGTSTLAGTEVNGYRITMSAAAIRGAFAKAHLPSSLGQALGPMATGASVTVYVGGGLVREIDIANQASSSAPIDVKGTMQFSGYGEPVSVQPPPATSVETVSQLARTALAGVLPTGPAV